LIIFCKIHSLRKKGTKAVTGAVPFQMMIFFFFHFRCWYVHFRCWYVHFRY